MGWSELNALENNLTSLNNSLSSYKSKLSTQQKRKEKIEELIKNMKKVCNDNSDDVTAHIKKIISNIDDALKGVSSASDIESDARADKEKDITDDGNMNTALSQLQSELKDVKNKISEYEGKISTKNTEIRNCKNAIRNEQRNIANSYKTTYDNAQWRYSQAKEAYAKEPTNLQLMQRCNDLRYKRNVARDNFNKYRWWL